MCLILFANGVDPRFPLLLAANRDEFHARPTAPATRWENRPDVVGGLDLRSGGTWLAARADGRWAAVTNVRASGDPTAPRSRGALVRDYVVGEDEPESFLERILPVEGEYGGYNLLLGQGPRVVWTSNRRESGPEFLEVEPGVHGLSNHLLDTPWPKVVRGREALDAVVRSHADPDPDRLLDILLDRAYAADHLLPETGVPPALERALSASFILTPEYGTRSSSALLLGASGGISFAERRFDPRGELVGEDRFTL